MNYKLLIYLLSCIIFFGCSSQDKEIEISHRRVFQNNKTVDNFVDSSIFFYSLNEDYENSKQKKKRKNKKGRVPGDIETINEPNLENNQILNQHSEAKNISIGNSMVLGNPDASVTIIKWTDFQ